MTASGLTLPAVGGVRLILARHGQTPSNVAHALDTLPPGPGLTVEGRRQAEQLAERLGAEEIVSVCASRASRAQETAAPLARRRGLSVDVAEGIQEIYVGDLEGTADAVSRKRFEGIYASWHFGELDEPMPGGETGRQAVLRFLGAARQAVDGVSAGSVALVSHGAMLRLVAAALTSVGADRANAAYLPNAGLIVLESSPSEPTGWVCLRWEGLDPA